MVSLSLVVVKGQSRLCLTEQLGVEALEGGGFALAAALDVAVEIFLRPVRKNTTRPLTVWIVGANVERGSFLAIGYGMISPVRTDRSGSVDHM